ncbi:hypothetical protein RUND412_002209 [Rhizina undulata]
MLDVLLGNGGGLPLCYLGITLLLASTLYFTLRWRTRKVIVEKFITRGRLDTAATPPRSLSPSPKRRCTATALQLTSGPPSEKPFSPTDDPSGVSQVRRASLTAIFTNILPKLPTATGFRRGSLALNSDSRRGSTASNASDPGNDVVFRTKEEIEAYGDFPDYAQLSGVRLPVSYENFNIDTALPRPYRPFRWAYHQTMSLTKMEPDWWLELENTYVSRIAQRKSLYAKHGKAVLDYLPGSEAACKELMEMALQFLAARYPQYFSLTSSPNSDSLAPDTFVNKILDETFNLKAMHPLVVILENVPEDFGITLRDEKTGFYEFRAGVICSSIGWNVGTKIGLNLREIHKPIPDYKEKMQFSMDRYFSKMPTSKPIQRGSWGIEVGQPLFMPPGDPHEKLRAFQDPELKIDDINLRVDWQTLRRLPLSSAIVFNFKALFTPLREFIDEPGVPGIVHKVLTEGKKNLMEYKGTWHVEHVVVPKLEEWVRRQEDEGLIERGGEIETLPESPYFKGWEEKWNRQQGF